ncbi:Hsp20/alpha crystallin family protein [Granulicella sp. dw_53]|uniref:Hsp20/alpha crystallin family protein n=1 Tax=Granulicella sp. dw_53 TaxID=2719792 RepID=UPI001BD59005|nr:Hsp20/alpha crystallin family protein [Granulicella sp. dw_53]
MTTMTRFIPLRTPFEDVAALQNRLNSIFNEIAHPGINESQSAAAEAGFVPPVDVYEDAQHLSLKLEVPGVKLEDLDIRLENQRFTIKGERRFETEEKAENFHRIERRFGSFVRSFGLPQTVDPESITASYDAGVLTISLKKKAEAQPKQVKIEVGSSAAPKQVEGSAA